MGKMARLKAAGWAVGVTMSALAAVSASAGEDRTQVGDLTCDISGGIGLILGSQRTLNCTFMPSVPGPVEYYAGTLTKLGVDIGVTAGGVMVWVVFAPTNRPVGALSGSYAGATAEASVGGGVGANVLVGGSNRTVALQPLSVQGQVGVNLALGVANLSIRPSR